MTKSGLEMIVTISEKCSCKLVALAGKSVFRYVESLILQNICFNSVLNPSRSAFFRAANYSGLQILKSIAVTSQFYQVHDQGSYLAMSLRPFGSTINSLDQF